MFALLSVVRQAADSFALAHQGTDILRALGLFNSQWRKYRDAVEMVGRRIASSQKAFYDLAGTRTRQLERHLDAIEQLRLEQKIAIPELDEADDPDTNDSGPDADI